MPANPNAAASIERVLIRLDQGEQLIPDGFWRGGQYCVLGIMIDEANLFDLQKELSGNSHLTTEQIDMYTIYYGLRSGKGEFNISDLTAELKTRIQKITGLTDYELLIFDGILTLSGVNDHYFYRSEQNKPDKTELNAVLADIIRSGAIFCEYEKETQ